MTDLISLNYIACASLVKPHILYFFGLSLGAENQRSQKTLLSTYRILHQSKQGARASLAQLEDRALAEKAGSP